MSKLTLPSPAFVVALVALFSSLTGGAVAAGIVPLAKRALTADTAKRAVVADSAKRASQSDLAANASALEGKSAAQLVAEAAAVPGPATSIGGGFSLRNTAITLEANNAKRFWLRCSGGEKAVGGGSESESMLVVVDSFPLPDGTGWTIGLLNIDDASATGTLHVVCVR